MGNRPKRTGEPAYDIYRRFRSRVDEQVAWALELLEKNKFDFTRKESYRYDREDAPWARDEAALRELWRKRVKNDILALRLSGKDEEKIRETLRKRYQTLRRRVHQLDADGVFQTFLNAYTLSIEPPYRLHVAGALGELRHLHAPVAAGDRRGAQQQGTNTPRSRRWCPAALPTRAGREDIVGWPLQDVVEKIRGPKGTVVRLSILPKSAGADGATKEVSIVRDKIKLEDQAAKSEIIEVDGMRFGIIDLPAFYRDFRAQAAGKKDFRSTTRDVRKLIAELKQEKVDGIIMDLRNNGGGSLTEAVELTGLFIPHGPVVQVKDSQGRLGQFSRGNDDLGRLRLTIAQFFRVQGGSTQSKGVIPDVVFPTAPEDDEHGERSLDNALPWTHIKAVDHDQMGKVEQAMLINKHEQRIARDPGFNYLVEQAREYRKLQERKEVSLVEAERKKEWDEREQRALERRNKLRIARGLDPLEKLGDEDEEEVHGDDKDDPEGINRIMQEEAARILADYIRQKRPVTAQAG